MFASLASIKYTQIGKIGQIGKNFIIMFHTFLLKIRFDVDIGAISKYRYRLRPTFRSISPQVVAVVKWLKGKKRSSN